MNRNYTPSEYLYGTTGVKVTKGILDERFKNHYSKSMTREQYDQYTNGWVTRGVRAYDCEGLLDAFLGSDVTADYCYQNYSTNKGKITNSIISSFLSTPKALGTGVYFDKDGKKTHVGFIVGCTQDGNPLIVEARGILHGVCMTKLSERPFTHYAVLDKKLKCDNKNPFVNDKVVVIVNGKEVYNNDD